MNDLRDTPIEELSLSVRAYNCLKRNNLNTIGDLLPLQEADYLAMRQFGRQQYQEVTAKLADFGSGGPATAPGDDGPDQPDGPYTFDDRVPRRPSPGGLTATAEAVPEPDAYQVDVQSPTSRASDQIS